LAVYVAYSLAIQAGMASVWLGMSAGVLLDRTGLVLCGFASDANAPAQDSDRQKPNPAPQCPVCFVSVHSAGNFATVSKASAFPAYVGLPIAAISGPIGDRAFVSQFRHSHGEPRAPPAFSV
jgi:hypothetical protein